MRIRINRELIYGPSSLDSLQGDLRSLIRSVAENHEILFNLPIPQG